MADDAHSLFSASGADAWGGSCPGKPAMEVGRKTSSAFADEGTAAHTLAAWVMEARIAGGKASAKAWLGHKITVEKDGGPKRVFTVSHEMAEHVDDYVDRFWLFTNSPGAERMSERRVHYHEFLGVEKRLAFGTSDGVGLLWDQPAILTDEGDTLIPAGDELVIDDLKYGKGVKVDADTMQLRLYAAGTLWEFGHLGDFNRVRLVIHQPRLDHVDEVVLTVDELMADIAKLKAAVPRVIEAWTMAAAMRKDGYSDLEVGEALDRLGLLGASDKACRFCDAAAVCPVMIGDVSEAVSGKRLKPSDFDDLTVDEPKAVAEYGGNYLAHAYQVLDRMEIWSKAVRAEIDRRVLLKGERFDGIKVVAGKRGAREWVDKGEAEALAMALPKPLQELVYKRELKTPTQIMDNALKSSPAFAMKFASLITQKEGKPAVVPLSDKRQAISHKSVAESFDDLTAEDEQPAQGLGASAGRDRHPFR